MSFASTEDRYESLRNCVDNALKRMKSDGLVKQLEKHEDSARFSMQRLKEVLSSTLQHGRERYLQVMNNQLEELKNERDEEHLRIKKAQLKTETEMKEARDENARLTELKKNCKEQIQQYQVKIRNKERHLQELLGEKEAAESSNAIKMTQIASSARLLSQDLSKIRSFMTKMQIETNRMLRDGLKQLKNETRSQMSVNMASIQAENTKRIMQKKSEAAEARKRTQSLRKSLIALTSTINQLSDEARIGSMINPDNPMDSATVISEIIKANADIAVKSQLKGSLVNTDPIKYALEQKQRCNALLKKKEEEYDDAIRQAKNRRRILQRDLDNALAQLISIKNHASSTDSYYEDGTSSPSDYQKSTQKLSAAMSKLNV